jgi:hypothetical protein
MADMHAQHSADLSSRLHVLTHLGLTACPCSSAHDLFSA